MKMYEVEEKFKLEDQIVVYRKKYLGCLIASIIFLAMVAILSFGYVRNEAYQWYTERVWVHPNIYLKVAVTNPNEKPIEF